MKRIKVMARDILANDIVEKDGVAHRVLVNVAHPAGRVILGGYADNHYPIRVVKDSDLVEVGRK